MSAWLDVAGVAPAARLPCQACGTWTCTGCGWTRTGANLAGFQDCPHCHGTEGSFTRTRHYARRIWHDHNPAIGPRCEGWYAYRSPGLPCLHPSCRQVTWGGTWEDWENVP